MSGPYISFRALLVLPVGQAADGGGDPAGAAERHQCVRAAAQVAASAAVGQIQHGGTGPGPDDHIGERRMERVTQPGPVEENLEVSGSAATSRLDLTQPLLDRLSKRSKESEAAEDPLAEINNHDQDLMPGPVTAVHCT